MRSLILQTAFPDSKPAVENWIKKDGFKALTSPLSGKSGFLDNHHSVSSIQQAALLVKEEQSATADEADYDELADEYYQGGDIFADDELYGIDADRFGVKEQKTGDCTLHVVVCQEKIKTEVFETAHMDKSSGNARSHSVKLSVAQIAEHVNTPDLLRYLPDDFLSEDQRKMKYEEIAETIKYIRDKNDRAYYKTIKNGDLASAQRMVDQTAKKNGYIPAVRYHQTDKKFTEFRTDQPKAGRNDSETPNGIFFKTDDRNIDLDGDIQMETYRKPRTPCILVEEKRQMHGIKRISMDTGHYRRKCKEQ